MSRPGAAVAFFLLMAFSLVLGAIVPDYGWSLFVLAPVVVGALAAAWRTEESDGVGRAILAALIANLALGYVFLALGIEGLLCLMMALPLWLPLATLGGVLGYFLSRLKYPPRTTLSIVALALLPAVSFAESSWGGAPPVYRVITSVVVDAPPDVVWRHVISFERLPEPRSWMFRAGIAYPTQAEIIGRGVGAERHCVFSTGTFVEPITEWQPGRCLAFDVSKSPPPLRELSPYDIHPPHLHGYLVSHRGRFDLIDLGDGRTRLVGTTWYSHGLRPAAYWRLWSDRIIHRVHLRVLREIRRRAESERRS